MSIQSIFVSGASSGIGLASALRLHQHGFNVFAGILPGEDTAPLAALNSNRMHIIPIDITKPEMIAETSAALQKATGPDGLYGLFNNAGIGVSGPIEFMPMELLRKQMEVNFFGHVAVTQVLLPLIRQARGRIVNTISILGRFVTPFSGAYCMSKFAMEAFTDTLRLELAPLGVQVAGVEPGNIKTPIWTKGDRSSRELLEELPPEARQLYGKEFEEIIAWGQVTGKAGISPDAVAKVVLHAFTARRPKTRYQVGNDAHLAVLLRRLASDRMFYRVIGSRMRSKLAK